MPRSASRRRHSLIDGEAVITRDDGMPDCRALRSNVLQRQGALPGAANIAVAAMAWEVPMQLVGSRER
jgi:hypothetical protein